MYCKKQHPKSVFSETRVSDEFKWFPAKKQALISDKTDFNNVLCFQNCTTVSELGEFEINFFGQNCIR